MAISLLGFAEPAKFGQRKRHTEPLKVKKVLTISSSEKKGCCATKLRNLPSARLLASMKSRSETDVRTAAKNLRCITGLSK